MDDQGQGQRGVPRPLLPRALRCHPVPGRYAPRFFVFVPAPYGAAQAQLDESYVVSITRAGPRR